MGWSFTKLLSSDAETVLNWHQTPAKSFTIISAFPGSLSPSIIAVVEIYLKKTIALKDDDLFALIPPG